MKAWHEVRPSTFVPRSDKLQLAIGSGLHHMCCGEPCRRESKQNRHHGKCGEVFRRQRGQRLLTRHEWAAACCVLTGTNQDALRKYDEIARELDMWELATRGKHQAAQELSEFCILQRKETKIRQLTGLALKSLHLVV